MDLITMLTIIVLIIMGLFHFYWAFGGDIALNKVLPTKDKKPLINPSKTLTFFVGIILITFSYIAYSLQFYDFTLPNNRNLYQYSGFLIAIIFILRAIGEFNAIGFFKSIKETEFAVYDTRYFSPLSLVLGLVFTTLAYKI